jgi:hypothetical protein
MNFPRRLKFRCPYCRRVYARSLSNVRLGPSRRKCANCGREFLDGAVEWPAATREQRMEYLFPEVLRVNLLLGFLFALLLSLAELPYWRGVLEVALWEMGIILIPIMVYVVRCLVRIRASVGRYERSMLSEAGYGGYPSPSHLK